jgi:hypothetical protein
VSVVNSDGSAPGSTQPDAALLGTGLLGTGLLGTTLASPAPRCSRQLEA